MTTYTAPVTEIAFVLREIADLPTIRTLPGYEEAGDDLVEAILDEAGRFAAGVLAPLNAAGDRQGCAFDNGGVQVPQGFAEAWQQFVAAGWNGLAAPVDSGGQGLPGVLAAAVSEIWNAANMAFALCPLLTQAAADLLERHGDALAREVFLPRLVSGAWTGTMLLTEPQAGTDLARVRSRAVRDGDQYRITGQKIYITFGEHDMAENIVHAVLARTPDAPPGVKGLSLFLVPKFLPAPDGRLGPRNDVRCIAIERKLGIHGSPTAVMSFGDGGGATGFLIGQENRGLEIMFTMMNKARLAVGLEGVGIADRAYQQARAYASERTQGRPLGRPPAAGSDPDSPVAIVCHPDVQRMLLTMKSRSEAARALAYFTAGALDIAHRHPDPAVREEQQRCVDLLTPVVKGWCTDVGIDVANTGIQVHGGMGYIEESGVPQFLRDARIAAIYEGTNGIQALDLVGRKVAADGGAALRALLARIRASSAGLLAGSPDLLPVRRRLDDACDHLAAATDWLVASYPADPRRVAAGAVHYLRLLGKVCGGWLLAVAAAKAAAGVAQAGAAQAGAAQAGSDPWFRAGKLKSARFFAETSLAEAGALRDRFVATGTVLQDFDPQLHL